MVVLVSLETIKHKTSLIEYQYRYDIAMVDIFPFMMESR
jgi:hypothetical protein